MKRVLVLLAVLSTASLSLVACGGGWSDQEKQTFLDLCNADGAVALSGATEAELGSVCQCWLSDVEREWSSGEEYFRLFGDDNPELSDRANVALLQACVREELPFSS